MGTIRESIDKPISEAQVYHLANVDGGRHPTAGTLDLRSLLASSAAAAAAAERLAGLYGDGVALLAIPVAAEFVAFDLGSVIQANTRFGRKLLVTGLVEDLDAGIVTVLGVGRP